jgi:hypothetical protein
VYFVSEGRIPKPATFFTENDAHNFVLESAVELFTAANIILGACRQQEFYLQYGNKPNEVLVL